MNSIQPISKESIFKQLRQILVEQFELDEASVTLEASLYDDLDIDSIDAVDLMVELKELTGKRLDPEAFKKVRTVDDVVAALYDLLNS
ncbi:MAG: acyl carrier protein [Kiloniellaceae bacterium]|mgnify:CR=1 FL=1